MSHDLLRRHDAFGDLLDKMNASLMQAPAFGADVKSDVVEKDDHYEVVADIPGVDKDDIKVDYEDGTLQISATRHEIKDHSDKDGNILQSERSFGSVGRSYYLPNVDREKVSAKYKNGCCTSRCLRLKSLRSQQSRLRIKTISKTSVRLADRRFLC